MRAAMIDLLDKLPDDIVHHIYMQHFDDAHKTVRLLVKKIEREMDMCLPDLKDSLMEFLRYHHKMWMAVEELNVVDQHVVDVCLHHHDIWYQLLERIAFGNHYRKPLDFFYQFIEPTMDRIRRRMFSPPVNTLKQH